MGAWGTGSFENDDALDWAFELDGAEDHELLRAAFEAVLDEDYPETPACCTALAAAEVVAALRGVPIEDLPEEVADWVEASESPPDDDLVVQCREAVGRVRGNSELRELWAESEDLAEWESGLDDLMIRLDGT